MSASSAATVRADAFEGVEVRGRVHPLELGPRRRSPPQIGAVEADEVEPGQHRFESGRAFGVAASGIVLGEQRVGRDEHHGAEGSGRPPPANDRATRPPVRSQSGDDVN